ncbi:MAG: amidotransferase 1, exosortase A system-associated [Nitrospirae bacterium]|nr:MAG: amidotransferase 1, exosortase A system-associated [Nitrospirota bacterium]
MCGIAGLFHPAEPDRRVDGPLLRAMTDALAHRGPDDRGFYEGPGVGLGHRRLSIIDLAGGHQPLANEDGSVWVCYNGEIYNFQPLMAELEAAGHRFATRCDTEVIVHAWEEWGAGCVARFRGMFAFALFDRASRTLFLARDRLGIKPLFHARLADGTLLFASELKGLLRHPELPRAVDPRGIEDYFAFGYVPEPRTILEGVAKLPPGHTLTVTPEGERLERYWELTFEDGREVDEGEAREELIARLAEAVRIRMVAEVPLGAFLSGGVDSSAVVALMAQASERPVATCSISFGDPAYDEARYARMVAERYRTDHHEERVEAEAFGLVDRLAALYDEPFADSSALPTYEVCRIARKRVTVALSGDGGDENLAGYRRYRWDRDENRVRRLLPQAVRGPLFGLLGRLYPKLDWAPRFLRAKATFQSLARDPLGGYAHSVGILADDLRARLFSPGLRRQLAGYRAVEAFRPYFEEAPTEDPLSRIQYLDLKTYLVGDILTKVDRASMAHALEVRVPILDHEVVEWIATLPSHLKLRGREGKYLFKKALEPLLPHEVLYRPKQGFAVPIGSWFRRELAQTVRTTLLEGRLARCGYFDPRFLARVVREHQAGIRDFTPLIWSLFMFDAFLRRVVEGEPAPELEPVGG